jgi:hypothetical protein
VAQPRFLLFFGAIWTYKRLLLFGAYRHTGADRNGDVDSESKNDLRNDLYINGVHGQHVDDHSNPLLDRYHWGFDICALLVQVRESAFK